MPSGALPSHVRVAIIGSGPAGLTAALYTSRANLAPLVVSGVPSGGQLITTTDVENFPGFPEGIQGPELVEKMRAQAARFGTTFVDANVTKVDLAHRPFTLELGSMGSIRADVVIVATGATARWLDLPSEQRLRGRGVSACATCDGFFFKQKVVGCVGGGDSAMEEALFLTKFAEKVLLIHRRKEFRASKIMLARARANPKIEFLLEEDVVDVLGEHTVTGLRLKNTATGAVREVAAQGLFLAIGHDPATGPFVGHLELDSKGYVKTHATTRTSVEGVFAAGDVYDHRYRQAITAAGLGCMAAIDAERFLAEEEAPSAAPPTPFARTL